MSPVPAIIPLITFFLLSGVGTFLEIAFKRITGRKVGGWVGRIWTWSYMLYTASLSVNDWMDAGMGGSYLTPTSGRGRLGVAIAGWISRWIVNEV